VAQSVALFGFALLGGTPRLLPPIKKLSDLVLSTSALYSSASCRLAMSKLPPFWSPSFVFGSFLCSRRCNRKHQAFVFLESAPFAETSVQRSDLSLGALTGHADLPPLAGNRRAIMEAASMCGNSCGIIAFAAEAASVQHPNRARWRRGVGGGGHGRLKMMQHQLLLASQHPRLQRQRHINSLIELIWT
jgi:hypothetical protein